MRDIKLSYLHCTLSLDWWQGSLMSNVLQTGYVEQRRQGATRCSKQEETTQRPARTVATSAVRLSMLILPRSSNFYTCSSSTHSGIASMFSLSRSSIFAVSSNKRCLEVGYGKLFSYTAFVLLHRGVCAHIRHFHLLSK